MKKTMELLLFLLIGFGVTTIITSSKIFEPLRDRLDTGRTKLTHNFFGYLIVCPLCVGFWWGLTQSIMMFSPTMSMFWADFQFSGVLSYIVYSFARLFALGCDGALLGGVCWYIHNHIALMNKETEYFETMDLYYQYEWSDKQRKATKQQVIT